MVKHDWADETEDRIAESHLHTHAHEEQEVEDDLQERTETITFPDGRQSNHKVVFRLVEVMEREYTGIVSRRESWVPFGRAKGMASGAANDPPGKVELVLQDQDAISMSGGGAITHAEKITQKDLAELERSIKYELSRSTQKERVMAQQSAAVEAEEARDKAAEGGKGVYKARSSGPGASSYKSNAEVCSLRIDNLSPETTEEALRILCSRIGNVSKLYLPTLKNPITGEKKCKGFAFVTFNRQSDAELAKTKLDRLPFQHSLLSVSWGAKSTVGGPTR